MLKGFYIGLISDLLLLQRCSLLSTYHDFIMWQFNHIDGMAPWPSRWCGTRCHHGLIVPVVC